jgi:hypothetical protein
VERPFQMGGWGLPGQGGPWKTGESRNLTAGGEPKSGRKRLYPEVPREGWGKGQRGVRD